MKKILFAAAALSSAALMPQAAQAANIMDTVTCSQVGAGSSFSCSSGSAVIGAGTEFQVGNLPGSPFFDVDFSTGQLDLIALSNFSLGATILEFTNSTNAFNSFSLLSDGGVNGFDGSDVSLANGILQINLIDTNGSAGNTISLAVGSVPEPATWAFMILGFGAIGGALRRNRKANVKVSYA